jgi:hypothetical protein
MRKACPVPTAEFGQRLAKFLRDPDVFRKYLPPDAVDWGAGGCWVLARALADLLPGARVRGVWGGKEGRYRGTMHHAVVEKDGCYIDHDGAQTEAQLLSKIEREGIREPFLGPWYPSRAKRTGIPCQIRSYARLQDALYWSVIRR